MAGVPDSYEGSRYYGPRRKRITYGVAIDGSSVGEKAFRIAASLLGGEVEGGMSDEIKCLHIEDSKSAWRRGVGGEEGEGGGGEGRKGGGGN